MSDDSAPIRALLFDDESLARLDVFVVALGESIDAIQDAEHLGHVEEVAKRCGDLAREAARLGLPALAVAAERVVASCRSGASAATRDEIVVLTEVVRRVRLGHRGSA
ncbi:MAG: hypothetical protein DCC71_14735 [Proteobacteria bacterium]|nr:MAG: hypothetical protein DCC71_14735 [Pseudomonadota bacterium]